MEGKSFQAYAPESFPSPVSIHRTHKRCILTLLLQRMWTAQMTACNVGANQRKSRLQRSDKRRFWECGWSWTYDECVKLPLFNGSVIDLKSTKIPGHMLILFQEMATYMLRWCQWCRFLVNGMLYKKTITNLSY